MTIDRINSGGFSEKDIKKAGNSSSASSKKAGSAGEAWGKVPKDHFSPSGTKLGGDFDLAATELDKLRNSSFSSLKDVKRKIDEGAYDSKEVHQKIGSLIEKDLQSVDQILSKMPGSEGVDADKKSLSPEYKKYLIENPKVIQKVADQVAQDLKNI